MVKEIDVHLSIALSIFLFIFIMILPVYAETQNLSLSGYSEGTKISDILTNPGNYANNNLQISGKVTDSISTISNAPSTVYTTYFKLNDGTGDIWAVTQSQELINIPQGIELTVKGFLMAGFKSNSTNNTTYDLIIFSRPDELIIFKTTTNQTSNQIEARQTQQERKLPWLEEKMNLILQWLRSII